MLVKKIFAYLAVFLGITALVLSTSKRLSEIIGDRRSYVLFHDLWWGEQKGKWGDLTSMSYLDQVKKFREPKSISYDRPADDGSKNLNLGLYGDSYVIEMPKEAFANLDTLVHYFRLGTQDCFLNRGKGISLFWKYLNGSCETGS